MESFFFVGSLLLFIRVVKKNLTRYSFFFCLQPRLVIRVASAIWSGVKLLSCSFSLSEKIKSTTSSLEEFFVVDDVFSEELFEVVSVYVVTFGVSPCPFPRTPSSFSAYEGIHLLKKASLISVNLKWLNLINKT